MIITKIIGGLGNQMFQYAYAKCLQQKKYDVSLDTSGFETYKLHGGYQLDRYAIDLFPSAKEQNNKFYNDSIWYKILTKVGMNHPRFIKEKSLLFDETFLKIEDDVYIDGYFQCEKYFVDIRDILLKQFTMTENKSNYTMIIEQQILSLKRSCSLHVRRGDYVSNQKALKVHGLCDINYYKKAINILNDRFGDITYFIFSDDIGWVKENLKIENAIYVETQEKRIPHEDIYLMSLCNHNIIANSSFSWWGAWLNQNEEKIVIAPKRWFANDRMQEQAKDIIPQSWIKI